MGARPHGRLAGTARHFFDPANQVYFATMEAGFYEVEGHTLAVNMIHPDADVSTPGSIGGSLLRGHRAVPLLLND